MSFRNKRGVSTIVTVVLLILVSITAVALIAAFVVPFIKTSLGESQECFSVMGKVDVVAGQFTCFNSASNEVGVRIKRGFTDSVKIKSIAVVLSSGAQSKRYDLVDGQLTASVREISGNYNDSLNIPGEGEDNTYVFNVTNVLTEVTNIQISPILESGKICEPATSVIPACAA